MVSVCERKSVYFEDDTKMRQFARLLKQRGRNSPQRIETHDHSIEHHNQIKPAVEAFGCTFLRRFSGCNQEFLTCQAIISPDNIAAIH